MTSIGLPNFRYKKVNDFLEIHIIQVKDCCDETKSLLDRYFVRICKGHTQSSPETVKKNIYKYLKGKNALKNPETKKTLLYGAIAEFFIHLHLNSLGYRQEFLFKNLEENSIKKGFDGLYSLLEDYWLVESKSGFVTTVNIQHPGKVKEAYQDISDKVAGKSVNSSGIANNPWENAYNHAAHRDVSTSGNLMKILHELQDEFTNDAYHKIEEFNAIPCSTIFLLGDDNDQLLDDIEEKVTRWHTDSALKNIRVICINFKAIEFFWEYITPQEETST